MEAGARRPTIVAMTTTAIFHRLGARPAAGRRAHRSALLAFAWTALFIAWHGYWALGGDFGFGDQEAGFPDTTSDLAGWAFTVSVGAMFAAGLVVPLAVMRGRGPRRLVLGLLWAGAAVLAARGLAGLADDALRFTGLAERGLSGLSNEQVLGTAHPSAYTIWSTVGLDAFFAVGAALFCLAALHARDVAFGRARVPRLASLRARLGPGWPAYVAAGLAAAYAIGVRGYQGLGGRIGIAGTFEDPAGMERASLQAGAFLLVVSVGCLALVRPWGLRLPRWAVIVPALAGSVFAMAHALTAYVTKPLDLLGAIDLELRGWATLDKGKLIAWDLLFYEPWFLALGVLVTLGTLHHHRRTGGTERGQRRLIALTVLGTIALTAAASAMVIARGG
jgi:uncharacterized protein DUF3995